MKQSAVLTLGAILLLGSGSLAVRTAVLARHPQGDDVAQLRALVDAGAQAARQRNSSRLGELISEDYRDGLGLRAAQVRLKIREAMRSAESIQVSVPPEQVHVEIDPEGTSGTVWLRALVTTHGGGGQRYEDYPLTLRVTKEPVRYYWVFPGAEWRVTSVEGYGGFDY